MNKHNKVSQVLSEHTNPYLEYLCTFPQLSLRPTDYHHLQSGVTLIELFLLIKNFQLTSTPQYQPRNFSHKFTNMKILLQSIELYWNNELQSQLQSSQVDMVEMCHTGCSSELDKLLSLFVKTAAQAENRSFFIEKILQTSQQTQQFLKQIIEKTMQHLKQSPRKEKEKRMIDRLLELDHENQRLQQIINTICQEKDELEGRLKTSSEILAEQTQEIQQLRVYLNEQTFTPQKRRMPLMSDTSERKDGQIDSLQIQLRQEHIRHQREMQQCLNQLEALSVKAQNYDKIKAQLQLAQSIIQSNQQLIRQAQEMESTLSQTKAELMNKQNKIIVLRQRLERQEGQCSQMERDKLQLKSELERKNHQLMELAAKIERSSPRKVDNHHNLYLQFPEIANTQANAYIQTNKALREELQRSRVTLQRLSSELDQAKAQLQPLRKNQQENSKLRQMLIQEKAYKGEEIDVLVHALYNLRKKVRPGQPEQRPLKNKNS